MSVIHDQDVLIGCMNQIGQILRENLELIDRFADLFKQSKEINQFIDLYEALHYELRIRSIEANNIITNIGNIQQQIAEQRSIKTEIPNIITRDLGLNMQPFQQQQELDPQKFYDLILDIDYASNIQQQGWKLFINSNNELKGANVAVMGLYDKGKTHILNQITKQNLPTGKKITTKGISLKNAMIDNGTQIVLIDTAGNLAPENMKRIQEKELTEQLILDIVFELGDYFICVVNDFTSQEQRYVEKLARQIQSSLKSFKEIIVIHNLRDIESNNFLQHVWVTQITQNFEGTQQRTNVDALNPFTNNLEQRQVLWYKTQFTRHLCIVNDESDLGKSINPWTYSLLKYWLKVVVVPHNKLLSLKDIVITCNSKLNNLFKKSLKLELQSTFSDKEKRIIKKPDIQGPIKDKDHGFQNQEEYIPQVDVIESNQYIILIDLPGVSIDEIEIYRQNVVTIIRGYKKRYLSISEEQYLKNERKCGHFELKFKIPTQYDRKWSYYGMNNGVLGIIYDQDIDEAPIKQKK